MAALHEGEFDLLQHMRLSSVKDDSQLTQRERQALVEQRRREVDEAQYVAHHLQEKVNRVREQFALRGRVAKPGSYTRDAADKYGLFWFGQGKYNEDELAVGRPVTRNQQQLQQEQESNVSDDSERAEDLPDELRFNVWQPVEGPPPPRGGPVGTALATANAQQQEPQLLKKDLHVVPNAASAAKRKKSSLTPPWAEHYATDDRHSNKAASQVNIAVRQKHQQQKPQDVFESGVLPRGVNGIDDILRHARNAQELVFTLQEWRMREDRRLNQYALKDALDCQLAEKRRRQLEQYEAELVHIYGPTMRHILTDAFGQPRKNYHLRHGSGDEDENQEQRKQQTSLYLQEVQRRQLREREEMPEMRAQRARQAWLAAWEDHKRRLADGAADSLRGDAELTTAHSPSERLHYRPSVLQFSDQILPMEQRRRDSRREYRDALDRQREASAAGLNKSVSLHF